MLLGLDHEYASALNSFDRLVLIEHSFICTNENMNISKVFEQGIKEKAVCFERKNKNSNKEKQWFSLKSGLF